MKMSFKLRRATLRAIQRILVICCLFFPISALALCCKCTDSTNASQTLCLTDTAAPNCASIITGNSASNKSLATVTCSGADITGPQCQTVSGGGTCQAGVAPAITYQPTVTPGTGSTPGVAPSGVMTPPVLQETIPGLKFANNIPIVPSTKTQIPYLAQYLSAVYNYLLGIVVIAAAIMIVYGGFRYILGSSFGDIKHAKQTITDAIIGLFLVFGAYTILAVLNPATVGFAPTALQVVTTEPFDTATFGRVPLGDTSGFSGAGATPETVAKIKAAAKLAGVDPCVLLGIAKHETNFTVSIWNGGKNNTRDKAGFFGICQTGVAYVASYVPEIRKHPELAYPTDPATLTRDQNIDWLLSDAEHGAYMGALMYRSVVASNHQNEPLALAAYAAGGGSINAYLKNSGCSPKAGLTFRQIYTDTQAGKTTVADALKASCLAPGLTIAIPGQKGYDDCASEGSICDNAVVDPKTAEFHGNCKGRPDLTCVAMTVGSYTSYMLNNYAGIVSAFQCTS